MSLFFDFDVSATGRRFRRAVDGDKIDIHAILCREHANNLFSIFDIGSLIELSALSICMIDTNQDVIGFMALSDHPVVQGVNPADWEIWIRNMYQKYYLSRNTLFIRFMCCTEDVADIFLEEALCSLFQNDVYLLYIILILSKGCAEENILKYLVLKKNNLHKICMKEQDENENGSCLFTAYRQDFCPKLKIRRAVEEDNDDIIQILDGKCTRLKELYGEYYISEIIRRYSLEGDRKIIVADHQDQVVGVMCLNSTINYESLQNTYDLCPFYGLRKVTALEKEQNKRSNVLLETFGDPILFGRFSPFDRSTKQKKGKSKKETPMDESVRPKGSSKVIFRQNSETEMELTFKSLYFRNEVLDDYSEKVGVSPSISLISNVSVAHLLDEDPFDYEIVNIDSRLLTVPSVFSIDSTLNKQQVNQSARKSRIMEIENNLKSKKDIVIKTKKIEKVENTKYFGAPNAFMIELFGLREDIDERRGFDLLEAAFEIMKTYDYCIIRVPCAGKGLPLLLHFCFVPTKANICCPYALYIAHRSAVLGKLRVRKAELIDIPLLSHLLSNLDVNETMCTVEDTVVSRPNERNVFVLLSGVSLVGVGVLESAEEIDYIQTKFNLDSYQIQKYQYRGHNAFAGFKMVKSALAYSVFEPHFRFFASEMMRLSDCNTLLWLTAYRNKWMTQKTNCLVSSMVPLLPRKSEIVFASIPELKKIDILSRNLDAFCAWSISKKYTTISKVNVDSRIVIIGASRTAMAFLNTLLFSDSCTYLTFTSVTLISPNGLPYVKNVKGPVETMFLKTRTHNNKYLKSVPYTYYVNSIQGKMTDVNKKLKYVLLCNGSKYYYDYLFILCGIQYQHPNYLKNLLEREKAIKCGKDPIYTPLDTPNKKESMVKSITPKNVFIINSLNDANIALKYIRNNLLSLENYTILVYGNTIHVYCCMATLLELGVLPENIVFIEPFPPEDKTKTRVTIFANNYVDQTVNDVLAKLKIKVYRPYYFRSWSCEENDFVTSVSFLSQLKMIRLSCSAFFYYGKVGLDEDVFFALSKSGMAYNSGLVIDHQYKTKDSAIYAAGPATIYENFCYAENKRQKYYDSYEVGRKLGEQIRNELDPMFTEKLENASKTQEFSASTSINSFEDATMNSKFSHKLREEGQTQLPIFNKPKVMMCTLPGGLQYIDVRSPGKKTPNHYVQSLQYNGHVLETFKGGYFKIHLTRNLIVDGITCLTPEKYALENFAKLYGHSAVVLNNVYLRYMAKKLDNFYEFFRSPWAYFLYHDQSDELFAMVKELLPKGQQKGETVKEALWSISNKLRITSCNSNTKAKIRSMFECSPHVEAITDYVIEWLTENEVVLPMYLQPWHSTEYSYDVELNPAFKKRKRSITKMMTEIL